MDEMNAFDQGCIDDWENGSSRLAKSVLFIPMLLAGTMYMFMRGSFVVMTHVFDAKDPR